MDSRDITRRDRWRDSVIFVLLTVVSGAVCFVQEFSISWVVILVSIGMGGVLSTALGVVKGRPLFELPLALVWVAALTIAFMEESLRPGAVALHASGAILTLYEVYK